MKSLKDRFAEKVERIPMVDCWIWTAGTNEKGYGILALNGKFIKAHRASYLIHKGEIPHGMNVLHKCGLRHCVNPDHLYPGTQKENVRDTIAMGRLRMPDNNGEKATWAKINAQQATEIYNAKQGKKKGTGTALARKFGVHKSTVYNIWAGVSWAQTIQAAS